MNGSPLASTVPSGDVRNVLIIGVLSYGERGRIVREECGERMRNEIVPRKGVLLIWVGLVVSFVGYDTLFWINYM